MSRFHFGDHFAGARILHHAHTIKVELSRDTEGEVSMEFEIHGGTVKVGRDEDDEITIVRKPGAANLAEQLLAAFARKGGGQ